MLRNLAIGKVILERAQYMPPALRPLVVAAEAGEPLEPALTLIVRNFGFDSFMYAMSVDPQITRASPPRECQAYVFTTLHELFCTGVVERGVPPAARGAPLSPRQRECLVLAARGLTTEDIAVELGITQRTAQFHFDCIRSKLGAANRQEAIAKAIVDGTIAV